MELTWLKGVISQMVFDVVGMLVIVQEAILWVAQRAHWDVGSTGNVPNK